MGQCFGRPRSPDGRVRQHPGNGTTEGGAWSVTELFEICSCYPLQVLRQKAVVPCINRHGISVSAFSRASLGSSAAPSGLRRFTYKELQKATQKFKEENLLGAGSFGKVYKATLDDWTGELPVGQKRLLAVKVLSEDSFQGLSEWMVRRGKRQIGCGILSPVRLHMQCG